MEKRTRHNAPLCSSRRSRYFMPRKLFKRILPHPSSVKTHPKLKFLGPLLEDPNLFHLNRHSVSLAFLVGVFLALALFPIPGQMLLAASLAFWVRCNLPIAVTLVWISNPITIPPIFFSTYKLGTFILDTPPIQFTGTMNWEWLYQELGRIWKPLLLGSFSAGIICSLLSFLLVRGLWRAYVLYHWYRRKQR